MKHEDFQALRESIRSAGRNVMDGMQYRKDQESKKERELQEELIRKEVAQAKQKRHEQEQNLRRELAAMRYGGQGDAPAMAQVRKNLPNDSGYATYEMPLDKLDSLLAEQGPTIDPITQAELAGKQAQMQKLQSKLGEGNEYPGWDWLSKKIGKTSHKDKITTLADEIRAMRSGGGLSPMPTGTSAPPSLAPAQPAPTVTAPAYPDRQSLTAAVQSGQLPVDEAKRIAVEQGWN